MRTTLCLMLFAWPLAGQGGRGLPSLKTVPVPAPTNLSVYVRDNKALVALGKALFWDAQAGSDGHVACATCHFHAGADHRTQNQLASPPGLSLSITPNQTLRTDSFPFRKLADPGNNRSAVVSEVRQAAGSAGQLHRKFLDIVPGSAAEDGVEMAGDANSTLGGLGTRQVTGRNTPSVINAVFNVRNFWDGRASNIFTGATPFGDSDPASNVLMYTGGRLQAQRIRIENASLASQAVGPVLNPTEMSYDGRTFPKLGKKMLSLAPLARQRVAPDDSVLGAMANLAGNGLAPQFTYAALIQSAFQPQYWSAPGLVDGQGNPVAGRPTFSARRTQPAPNYSHAEYNFALFWGLAIAAYESTLVSDDSPVDQFAEGKTQALTDLERQGMNEFLGGATCLPCHQGAETTLATFANAKVLGGNAPDSAGFFRTGVSPIAEDVGLGGTDGFGAPLFQGGTAAASGTFKSTGLRNVEFTGPYMHNGSQATLEQAMDFYARNGDIVDGGGLARVQGIRLNATEKAEIVAFLKALTDDRVRFERAPFDHPELCVPNGHVEQSAGKLQPDTSDFRFGLSAAGKWALIPAVGRGGNPVPLQTFQELLSGTGNDGSRAHTLTQSCVP